MLMNQHIEKLREEINSQWAEICGLRTRLNNKPKKKGTRDNKEWIERDNMTF